MGSVGESPRWRIALVHLRRCPGAIGRNHFTLYEGVRTTGGQWHVGHHTLRPGWLSDQLRECNRRPRGHEAVRSENEYPRVVGRRLLISQLTFPEYIEKPYLAFLLSVFGRIARKFKVAHCRAFLRGFPRCAISGILCAY